MGPHSSFARITSQDVLKHPNLHDRVKQATCRRFWGFHSFCFNDFDSVENLFTSFQQQTGGLLFEKNNAKEFLQIAIYFVTILFYRLIAAATHLRCFHEQFVNQHARGDLAPGCLLLFSNGRSSSCSSACCCSPTAFPAAMPHSPAQRSGGAAAAAGLAAAEAARIADGGR